MWFSIALADLPTEEPPRRHGDEVRLVFIGDTGQVPDGLDCLFEADGSIVQPCHIDPVRREQLRTSIRAAEPDAIYALGDLVYWRAPTCSEPSGRKLELLDAAIGGLFTGLGAPVYLVLGNHDVAQRRRSPGRVRCLSAYAERHPELHLPDRQYVVQHGLADVLVVDTNDGRGLPSGALKQLDARPGWLVIAAHHELRTAFDKEGVLSNFEVRPGLWLSEQDVAPDLWTNGHAHVLQFGTYDARKVDGRQLQGDPLMVPSLTAGVGSKLRQTPTCPGDPDCQREDPRGMPDFSIARFGYGLVTLTDDRMTVSLRDHQGNELFAWSRDRVE